MTKMTVRQANEILRESETIINLKDGEYRLSDRYTAMAILFPSETRAQIQERIELRAYYTNDLQDAVATAKHYRPSLARGGF